VYSFLKQDRENANKYFASVYYDPEYSVDDVLCFVSTLTSSCNRRIVLAPCEVEHLLYRVKPSSPGLDNIPRWFFHNCSYEIAEVVGHILNLSFDTFDCGAVPRQWRQAVVTPVPKVASSQASGYIRI